MSVSLTYLKSLGKHDGNLWKRLEKHDGPSAELGVRGWRSGTGDTWPDVAKRAGTGEWSKVPN